MIDLLNDLNKDLNGFRSYVETMLESSGDGRTQCFEDFKKFVANNKKIKPLSSIKTHSGKNKKTGKDFTYLLFATAESDLNGSYKKYVEDLKKNVKLNGEEANWCSIYLPGDVFIAIKLEDRPVTESSKNTTIKNIVFDFGSVLVKNTSLDEFYKSGIPKDKVRELVKRYFEFIRNDETATIQNAMYGYKMDLPEELRKYSDKAFTICATSKEKYDYTVPLLKYLKSQGYKIYYLSNWARSGFELMKKKNIMDFMPMFDGGIVSYEVGFQKPGKEIYNLLLKKYKLKPEECLFFDDKEENCTGARAVGMKAIRFSQDTVKDIMSIPKVGEYTVETYDDIYSELSEILFEAFIFHEDSKYDNEMYAYGPEYVKNLRKVEILKSQLKRGQLTQEEFDKEYQKVSNIKQKFRGSTFNIPVPKNGKKSIELNRPNKNSPDNSMQTNIKNYGSNTNAFGKPSDNMNEKINHYADVLETTENYNEYKDAFKNISRILGNQKTSAIKIYNRDPNNKSDLQYRCYNSKQPADCNSNTKLYHTTTVKGLNRLNGRFRSSDNVCYSSKRVYFCKDYPGGRVGGGNGEYSLPPNTYVYEFIGDASKAFIDPELGGNAVFIETDTSVPVRDVTNQFTSTESVLDILLESTTDTHIMKENLYPKVADVLSTPIGDRKFKQMVGAFMDRNSMKLHTAGPTYLVPFADRDKAEFFNLFKLDQKWIKKLIKEVTNKIGSGSAFKLLSDNPIYWVFYCCIRYYTMKKDAKGLNTALSIYALSNYPSVFHMSFPYPPNPAVMQYTMDNLSNKYIMKQAGHVFGGLFLSIQNSYKFLEPYMADASDKEIIRFIQRIRNDQKSMMKNICDQYMKNHAAGNRVKLNMDNYDGVQLDVDSENNTTIVQTVADNVVNQIITGGLDLRRVSQCKDIAQIGMSDCRFYLSKIITDKYTKEITAFIYSILFLFLYDEKKTKQDINSTFFLKWSSELFRKTNSNNPNIKNIKDTLDKWGEETGVHAKFKREASRVNYKKAIFWYFILSIQYYNK